MFSRGFGGVRGLGVPGSAGEFEQMARQYWDTWEQALRGLAPGAAQAQPGSQSWQDALKCWTDVFAHRPVTNDVMDRFGTQARQWYAQIQQVAAQFSGRSVDPAEITQAWKSALGGAALNPFQHLLDSMNGPGMHGMEHWLASVQPVLDSLMGQGRSWLNTPAFGFAREHQERLQALAAAQLEVQHASHAYQEVMASASQTAFQRFEQRLTRIANEGHAIDTPRALFDVWVDAAEDAYAEVALTEEYRRAYGNLLNAQMRLRAGIQGEVEQSCAQLGMPTRSELDGAHRKIVELERELRRLRECSERAATPAPTPTPTPTPITEQPAPAPPRPKAGKPAKPAKPASKAVKKTSVAAKPAPAKAAKAADQTSPARTSKKAAGK